ncbi:MAG: hydroxylamine reductase, partial [Faecalibacterium sp.]
LGIRNIRLGPTLPPFLSPVVVAALQQKYNLKAVTTPENDLQAILGRH